jgi:hypothetical protein
LAHKIDEFLKSKETMEIKALEVKVTMNNKNVIKQVRWVAPRDFDKRKIAL